MTYSKHKKIILRILLLVLSLMVIFTLVKLYTRYTSTDSSTWYAVYLNNNQIYFGTEASIEDNTLLLKNVHTLETVSTPKPISSSKNFALEPLDVEQITYKLIKRDEKNPLGGDGNLLINYASVLLVEKLASSSEILKLLTAEK